MLSKQICYLKNTTNLNRILITKPQQETKNFKIDVLKNISFLSSVTILVYQNVNKSKHEMQWKMYYLWNTSRTSDQYDIVDLRLVHLGVSDGFFDGLHGGPEQIGVQFFESGPGDRRVEIDTLEQRIDFNAGLCG